MPSRARQSLFADRVADRGKIEGKTVTDKPLASISNPDLEVTKDDKPRWNSADWRDGSVSPGRFPCNPG
jgi:hypothetical protein